MTASTTDGAERSASRHRTIRVTVNRQPVGLPNREVTGLEVKEAAVAQGVQIQLDFQLSVKQGDHYEVIGDTDKITVRENEEFLAVAPDDNS